MPDRAAAVLRDLRAGRPLGARARSPAQAERAQLRAPDRDRPRPHQSNGQGSERPVHELRRAGRGGTRGARPAPADRDRDRKAPSSPPSAWRSPRLRCSPASCSARRAAGPAGRARSRRPPPRSTRCNASIRRRTSWSRRSAASARIRTRSRSAPVASGSAARRTGRSLGSTRGRTLFETPPSRPTARSRS